MLADRVDYLFVVGAQASRPDVPLEDGVRGVCCSFVRVLAWFLGCCMGGGWGGALERWV